MNLRKRAWCKLNDDFFSLHPQKKFILNADFFGSQSLFNNEEEEKEEEVGSQSSFNNEEEEKEEEVGSQSSFNNEEEEEEDKEDYVGGGGSDSILKYVEVQETRSSFNKKFNVHDKQYIFKFRDNLPKKKTEKEIVNNVMNEIINYAKRLTPEFKEGNDIIRIIIQNSKLNNPISSDFKCQDPVRSLLEKLMAIITSDDTIKLEDTLFHVQVICLPHGKGRSRLINIAVDKRTKNSILRILNTDSLCGLRAIVTALTYHTDTILGRKLSPNEIIYVRKGRKIQTELAYCLRSYLDMFDDRIGCTINEIPYCEEICEVRCKIISSEHLNSVIYEGNPKYERIIYLYLQPDNHFDVITSMKALLGRVYYCFKCDTGYDHKEKHRCKKEGNSVLCLLYMQDHKDEIIKRILCIDCNRYCKNDKCMRFHKCDDICGKYFRCINCGKLEKSKYREKHQCYIRKCKNCEDIIDARSHLCHMKKVEAKGGKCSDEFCTCKINEDEGNEEFEKICEYEKVFGSDLSSLKELIKSNFRRLALKLHPDKNKPTSDRYKFGELVESYNNLRDSFGIDKCINLKLNGKIVHEYIKDLEILEINNVICSPLNCIYLNTNEPKPIRAKSPTCSFTTKYIFYDYECRQETGVHIPALIVAMNYEGERFIFETNEEFCKWAISKKHRGYTFIAHYARGYDSYFIVKYCLNNTILPYIISQGSKISLLSIKYLRIRFIDSHNFIGTPLLQFPSTFGLIELKKGYFPHYFHTVSNENYIGCIPEPKYYGYNTMKPSIRASFLKWHSERIAENYQFNLKKELLEYCTSDVSILRQGCLKFREEFLKTVNVDPYIYTTLPSLCLAIYRAKYMKSNTIAVFRNFDANQQYSKASISWLQSLPNATEIRHACNGGEVNICGGLVDGFHESTHTVYQFMGCYYHGCKKCFPDPLSYNSKLDMEIGDLNQRTCDRTNLLRANGYHVIEKWECEWKQSSIYKNTDLTEIGPLNPRRAYFGLRSCRIFKLYKKADGQMEKIRYVDILSLYPTVMRYDKYPLSHPKEKLLNPVSFDPMWFGLIKCKILPPRQLYIPVLPIKIKMKNSLSATYEKLIFPLCRSCAKECSSSHCFHSNPEDRVLVGEWTTEEVKLALKKGYQILKIYEVWNFDSTTDLFKDYIDSFMKLKLQSSPYEGSKEEYAKEIKKKMGIQLDLNKIKPNPVKRQVSKTSMNSLYGKFGQRDTFDTIEFVKDCKKFYNILLDDSLEVSDVIPITDEIVQMKYKKRMEEKQDDFNTNVLIALFTTSNARIRLYKELDKLKERVLYCDTDSIIYIDDGSSYTIPIGEALGEFSNELDADDFIIEFISTGPKSYYYRTWKGKEVTKMKGFTLNHQIAQQINAQTMKQLIDNEISILTRGSQIFRDTKAKELINKSTKKRLVFNYNKRVIINNYDTIPYGTT